MAKKYAEQSREEKAQSDLAVARQAPRVYNMIEWAAACFSTPRAESELRFRALQVRCMNVAPVVDQVI